jgi:predicted  nucleic acid-binding Zn-ribbon protein
VLGTRVAIRYEATLRQLEAELAKVTAERDALKVDLSEAIEKRDELQDEVWDLTSELESTIG